MLISCGAAIICGAAVALMNFVWAVGQRYKPLCVDETEAVLLSMCDIPVISIRVRRGR